MLMYGAAFSPLPVRPSGVGTPLHSNTNATPAGERALHVLRGAAFTAAWNSSRRGEGRSAPAASSPVAAAAAAVPVRNQETCAGPVLPCGLTRDSARPQLSTSAAKLRQCAVSVGEGQCRVLAGSATSTSDSSAIGPQNSRIRVDFLKIQSPSPSRLRRWGTQPVHAKERADGNGRDGVPSCDNVTAEQGMRADQPSAAHGLSSGASPSYGSAVSHPSASSGGRSHRLDLRLATPSERGRDFTRVVDPHADVMRRLEAEHRQRFRRALYVLQQAHPDTWWRLQSADYYDVRMPEVLACDDGLCFSRVTREVRDAGVQRLSLRSAVM
ncbi:hypothetical protein DQ04_01161020 [Trypanosoma grayi]|uniref:hypothetical protein n=1 Tax=Trypanosoma grayi TaxID=71804 RepID=UPI0004F421CD|nr:hypothetical protein DQ04_01161020 [Trypanosoma grayi]KEG13184.1 hypothetical protein DQ04_01161020 [Trypanosoma grayi]